jgi:hypothetical protein
VQPDVVRGPPGAELLTEGGELTDKAGEVAVVRVAPGFGPQQRDEVCAASSQFG